MDKVKVAKVKKILKILTILVLIVAVVHIIVASVSIYQDNATSFPWYSAAFFVVMDYIPIFLILAGVHVFVRHKGRK